MIRSAIAATKYVIALNACACLLFMMNGPIAASSYSYVLDVM